MNITIVYDNESLKWGLTKAWGFSCLIQSPDMPTILFDTGAMGSVLLHNMAEMELDPREIDKVVISHPHADHIGGLWDILEINPNAEVYLPASITRTMQRPVRATNVTMVTDPIQICPTVFTTGILRHVEQSLVITLETGVIVVAGCSHPGVGRILAAASTWGKVRGIIGGLHAFDDFEALNGLDLICPCHCTEHKKEIQHLFPEQHVECGAGLVLEL